MNIAAKTTLFGFCFLTAGVAGYAAPAAENWENHCAKCHGADGKGDTKIGKKLKLKDYTDAAVQAKMTDADVAKAIAEGVTEGGKERMKSFKDVLSKEEADALAAYVRKFKA